MHALRGVNLIVEPGEFIAIMGSSGSGKSTLMALLGCLDRPTSGDYYFEGVDVARLSEPELAHIRSERLGFVFQSFNLLARTSAIENVALPLFYAAGGPRAGPSAPSGRARRSIFSASAIASATHRGSSPAASSSASRLRAHLINNPSLLLADEPTGNLDTRTSHDIMETLQIAQSRAGALPSLSSRMSQTSRPTPTVLSRCVTEK